MKNNLRYSLVKILGKCITHVFTIEFYTHWEGYVDLLSTPQCFLKTTPNFAHPSLKPLNLMFDAVHTTM